jgi:hypothetical protein
MARKKETIDAVDDLLGPSPEAAAPTEAPAAETTKPAKKKKAKAATLADLMGGVPKKKAKAAPAPAPAAKAKAKAPKRQPVSSGTRAARGKGKFFFPADSEEFKAVRTAAMRLKSATGTRDFAEKQGVPTWQARLVLVSLVNEGRGKLKRASGQRELTYTPA